ncbi:MAG: hypothetical protein HKN05_01320 [Rhizobiales bacterium]|nr:hypothetical protein [Hyphomicrobiales bacterium]
MKTQYQSVMDPDQNSLRRIPPAQRFQIMVYLSMMWTAIFCFSASAWAWYGELVVGHIAVALGVMITGMTFHNASRSREAQE